MTGSVNAILTALHLVLSKLQSEEIAAIRPPTAQPGDDTLLVKLLVPNKLCGALIGKGGETIRNFISDSQAIIRVASPDEMPYGVSDRVVRVMGSLDQILRAVALVVTKVMEDERYDSLCHTLPYMPLASRTVQPLPLAAAPGMMPPYQPGVPMLPGGHPRMPPPLPGALLLEDPLHGSPGGARRRRPEDTEVHMAVPDSVAGFIIGRQGRGLKELQQMLGVSIVASGREEYLPGTQDRRFTVTGPEDRVNYARMILASKVDKAKAVGGRGGSRQACISRARAQLLPLTLQDLAQGSLPGVAPSGAPAGPMMPAPSSFTGPGSD